MAERDPRVDPRPGDRLLRTLLREVVERKPKTVVYRHIGLGGDHCRMSLAAWQRWARTATIIHTED